MHPYGHLDQTFLINKLTEIQVVDWFVEAKKNLSAEYDYTIPSLAFFHIPSHAMLKYQQDGFDASRTPGINGEKVVSQGSMDTDYSGQDRRFMEALLNTTGLMATFSGHDHKNDWYVLRSWADAAGQFLTCTGVSNGTVTLWIRT